MTAPAQKLLLWEFWPSHDRENPGNPAWIHMSFVGGHVKWMDRFTMTSRIYANDPNWTWNGTTGVDFP